MKVPPEGGSLFGARARPDYRIDRDTGCWVWLKATLRGYPIMGEKKPHRMYWEAANGCEIPPDHQIHHLCHNRACVNPEHLELLHREEHFRRHWFEERPGMSLELIRQVREAGRDLRNSPCRVAKIYGLSQKTVEKYWRGEGYASELPDDQGPIVPVPHKCRGCDELVVGRSRGSYFHSDECRNKWRHRNKHAGRVKPLMPDVVGPAAMPRGTKHAANALARKGS